MPRTIEQFAADIVASGIVAREELAQFQAAQAAQGETIADAQALARLLVRHGKLTKYQAAALYQGKSKGLVLGNYVLLDKLGAGGMGQVFKALHRRMDRVVALKILPAEATKSPENVKRFQREVKAAARLEHPNIVAAHDADEADGTHFLVMQYVEGKDLSAIVKEHGPLPVAQAVECIRQAAQGLAYAHKRGVIHRDIKPANLLLDSEGTVKILDMGLARLEGQLHDAASIAGLTQSGQVMGTVDYMSPEQAEETRGVDARADQYSLGCTLWVLLTGRPMFGGTTTISKLMAHRTQPAPSLRAARADAPEALEAVYQRLVAKEPDARFASMDEVIAALTTCLGQAAPATLDGPSSSDSRLTDFFQQIAGAKTSAPPQSITAIDAETMQRQPVKEETGTEHFQRESIAAAEPAQRTTKQPAVSRALTQAAVKPAPKIAAETQPGRAPRKLHPLVLAAALAVAGVGSLGILLAFALWLVLPGDDPPPIDDGVTTVAADSAANHALDFDGQRSYVEIPTLKLPQGPLTVEAWITPRKADREAIFLADGDAYVSLHTYQNSIGFWREAPSFLRSANQSPLVAGERVHIAGVWDGNKLRAYINGEGTTIEHSPPSEVAAGHLLTTPIIGGELRDGKLIGQFNGQIDELRVSTVARYDGDFTPPAADTRFTPDKETLALYHFDEARGNELRDSSSNNHHGKIVGAKWVQVARQDAASALHFTRNARVELPALPLAGLGELCVEAWVTPQIAAHGEAATIFNAENQASLKINPQGHWDVVFSNGKGQWHPLGSPQQRINGQPTHVAGVLRPEGVRLFVNGKRVAYKPAPNFRLGDANQPAIIGDGWEGTIQALRISKVARYEQDFTPLARLESDGETLALYRFDEGTGDVLRDSSGNNHHGKIVGAKWVRPDTSESAEAHALDFAADARVELPPLPIAGSSELCVEGWVTPRRLNPEKALCAFNADHQMGLHIGTHGRWYVIVANPERELAFSQASPELAVLGRRVHVAGTLRPDGTRLYLDGKLVAHKPITNFRLGSEVTPHHIGIDWDGTIDQVRISKVARYEQDFAPPEQFQSDPDTLALYRFNEGQGDVLRDSSGNNRHGKIVGAKWVRVESLASAPADDFALEFDGSAEQRVATPLAYPADGVFTIEGWATRTGDIGRHGLHCVMGTWEAKLKLAASGDWRASVITEEADGENNSFQSTTHNLAELGRRTHLALVADGKIVRFYIDGHLEYRFPLPRKLKLEGAPIGWGGKLATGMVGFPGILDEIRISNVARYVNVQDFDPPDRHVPDQHTLALYHCDEGTGDVVNDSSGNQHHGKIFGATWVKVDAPPPPPDFALKFDGKSLVEIPSLERNAAEPLTIEAWVKDVAVHTGILACVRGKRPAQMHVASNSAGKYLLGGERLPDGKLWREISSHETYEFASWTHCAYVIDERGATVFVDGKQAGEVLKADYATPWSVAYRAGASIGGDGEPGKPAWTLRGSIRELRFSSSVRYNGDFTPRSRFESDALTLALYHFDEGAGDVLNDASGNNHHGKIVGAKWIAVSGERKLPDSASAPAASKSITPADGMVDLLPLIDVANDKVVGVWEQDADGLLLRTKQGNQIEQFSRLALPVAPTPGSSYHVQAEFTASQDGRGMGLILPIGDRQVMAGVAIVGGLGLVDGRQIGVQGNPTLCNPTVKAGTKHTLDVWVRPAGGEVEVEAQFDGSALFRWQGKTASLALHDDWNMPRADELGLCEWSLVPFTVHELKLEILSGEAKVAEAK